MCRKLRPAWNGARKKDFSFSDKLRESGFGRLQGKTRPGVQQAQNFAHHFESVAGASPPVSGIVRVSRGAADRCLAVFRGEALPQGSGTTRVNFGSDDDDAVQIFFA